MTRNEIRKQLRRVAGCGLLSMALLAQSAPAQNRAGSTVGGGGGAGHGNTGGGAGATRTAPAQPRSNYNFELQRNRQGEVTGGGIVRGDGGARRPDSNDDRSQTRPDRPDPNEGEGPGGHHGDDPRDDRDDPPSRGELQNKSQHDSLYRDYRDDPIWQRDNKHKYPDWDRDGDGRPDRWRQRGPRRGHDFHDWRDLDYRHIDDADYRRSLYYESFYRYYPLPLWDDGWFALPLAESSATYEKTSERVTETDTGEQGRGPWVEEREVEVPNEEEIAGETVEVYHPAVYRVNADGTREQLEPESTTREPKVRIVLKKQRIPGHYANDPVQPPKE